MEILAAECRDVFDRIWNSKKTIFFTPVFLINLLGVLRAKEKKQKITRRMDLWERGLHKSMV